MRLHQNTRRLHCTNPNKFYKKTGRKLQFDATEPVGFDKTKVECYNCHKIDHFARECRTKGNQDSRRRDAWNSGNKDGGRSGKQEDSKALVTIDGEGVDWTSHSEEEEGYALMACNSSGSNTKVTSCSNECKESYAKLKKLYDAQREQLSNASIEIKAYTQGPKQTQPIESESQSSESDTCESNISTEPSKLVTEPVVNESNVESQPKVWSDAPIIEEYESDSEDEFSEVTLGKEKEKLLLKPYQQVVIGDRQRYHGGLQNTMDYHIEALKKKVILLIVGCSRHMTGGGTDGAGSLGGDEFQDFSSHTGALLLLKVVQLFTGKGQQEANQNAGTEEIIDSGDSDKEDESAQDCFVLPIWPSYSSTITPALTTDDKREGPREEEQLQHSAKASSTNPLNTISIPVSTASPYEGLSLADPTHSEEDDLEIPPLEDIYQNSTDGIFTTSSYDDEGAVADFTNLETVVHVSPIPTLRIHSTHPKALILGDPNLAVQTRSKKPKKNSEALEDESWLMLMQQIIDCKFEIQKKPLVKDEEASDVDVHLYRSMIGSLMYLTASRPDIIVSLKIW
ncbi:ribonuclease H-like domain-containing protein [Tanacetum coccineum]